MLSHRVSWLAGSRWGVGCDKSKGRGSVQVVVQGLAGLLCGVVEHWSGAYVWHCKIDWLSRQDLCVHASCKVVRVVDGRETPNVVQRNQGGAGDRCATSLFAVAAPARQGQSTPQPTRFTTGRPGWPRWQGVGGWRQRQSDRACVRVQGQLADGWEGEVPQAYTPNSAPPAPTEKHPNCQGFETLCSADQTFHLLKLFIFLPSPTNNNTHHQPTNPETLIHLLFSSTAKKPSDLLPLTAAACVHCTAS